MNKISEGYPFWEMGEDLYKDSYVVPAYEYEIEDIQEGKIKIIKVHEILNEIYQNIKYLQEKFPDLIIGPRYEYPSTCIMSKIHISLKKEPKVYTTYVQNSNIADIIVSFEGVYKIGCGNKIGYNSKVEISTVWSHRDLKNIRHNPGNFIFSYEKLYEILKDCEVTWNPSAYMK